MSFFTAETLQFFTDLRENNNRDWFNAHKSTYEKYVKEPFTALCDELAAHASRLEPDFPLFKGKDLIFRIHRDTRFAKDKAPYKDHTGAYLCKMGKKSEYPGFYIHVSDKEPFVGGGLYQLSPDNLKKVRYGLMYHSSELRSLLETPDFASSFQMAEAEKNKVLPAEFKQAALTEPMITHKQFFFTRNLTPQALTDPDYLPMLKESYRAALPVMQLMGKFLMG